MKSLFVLAILATFGAAADAEVLRCADAAGNVSYTDNACPPGAKPVGRVAIPEPVVPTADEAERRRQAEIDSAARSSQSQRESAEAAARQPAPQPSGPIVIDAGRTGTAGARPSDSRWSNRSDEPAFIDDGQPYPGVAGSPVRPRNMAPRIRNCDAGGCQDTQGNHYNRSGQIDRYRSIDGKTCQPVGTTTICR